MRLTDDELLDLVVFTEQERRWGRLIGVGFMLGSAVFVCLLLYWML